MEDRQKSTHRRVDAAVLPILGTLGTELERHPKRSIKIYGNDKLGDTRLKLNDVITAAVWSLNVENKNKN